MPVLTLACLAGNSEVRSPGKSPSAPSHRGATGERKTGRANARELLCKASSSITAVDGLSGGWGTGYGFMSARVTDTKTPE